MKQNFLLDENILYHAVRGVDKHDNPDATSAELLDSIARICHRIAIHTTLLERYYGCIQKLRRERAPAFEPVKFITDFIKNTAKRNLEFGDLPELPEGVEIPEEDKLLVRASLISHPAVVTADSELREAIKAGPGLDLKALSPREALELSLREGGD